MCISNVKYLWKEAIYAIVSFGYLIKLHLLNQELFRQNFEDSFSLLRYNNHIVLTYFSIAVALFFIGVFFMWQRVCIIKDQEITPKQLVASLVSIVVLILILLLIIIFINNPILRAVFTAAIVLVLVLQVRK